MAEPKREEKKQNKPSSSSLLLQEEFGKSEKEKKMEEVKERLKKLDYKFSRFSNLPKQEQILINQGYQKYGEDGANLVRRYVVSHKDTEYTQFMRYLVAAGTQTG